MSVFINIKNSIDFFLRNKFPFSRKYYNEKNEDKNSIFISEEVKTRADYLIEKYGLNQLYNNTTVSNFLENLDLISVLDKYCEARTNEEISVLDIGCKNWSYAQAEMKYFAEYSNKLTLKGIEIDPNRLYTNLFSRYEVSKFYTRGLENTEYIKGDFLKLNEKFNYIIWILPFVLESPQIDWGLPSRFFKPMKMLKHAYNSLKPNGKLFIINQGEAEYCAQKVLYEHLGLTFEDKGEIFTEISPYKHKRYLTIVVK